MKEKASESELDEEPDVLFDKAASDSSPVRSSKAHIYHQSALGTVGGQSGQALIDALQASPYPDLQMELDRIVMPIRDAMDLP